MSSDSKSSSSDTLKKEWTLNKESEIRCEVFENSTLTLKLISGSAEIFGIELAPNKEYYFSDQNIAVFTWYGCTLETLGSESNLFYIADSTPMVAYVNTHVQLEARRDVALANSSAGPRVMVVGPVDSGKSTICQILAAYAVRLDRVPVYVDLDVGQGALSIPGCVTAAPLDKSCLSIEDGFTNFMPLTYFYGQNSPKDNVYLYKQVVSNLAAKINMRLEKDVDAKASGLIVNTCGLIEGVGFDLLLHCVSALSIDVVLVMGHDKLYSSLVSSLDTRKSNVTVVKLPRSGGVVNRDSTHRRRVRKCKIREYFYGKANPLLSNTLYSPERREGVPINSFVFLRAGGVQISSGMRLIGESTHQDPTKLSNVAPTGDLVNSVVAVLHHLDPADRQFSATSSGGGASGSSSGEDFQDLVMCNIAGFVSVVQLDAESGTMTLLCPCPGALPSHYLLVGSIKWVE
jgi:polyribonucleotide 5'-hydroxyl-kinase